MGIFGSKINISNELLDDYLQLTFLNQYEIARIYKRMEPLCDGKLLKNLDYRYKWIDILEAFPEFKYNPFNDRLLYVFSSQMDERLSFEDVLNMCSALSPNCSAQCKAKWALKIFDFNNSNAIELDDICELTDRLTAGQFKDDNTRLLSKEEKEKIATVILDEIDFDETGAIITVEFVHAVSKIPDFASSFTLRI